MDKRTSRIRRARKTRAIIQASGRPRLAVFKSSRHIYAQLLSGDGQVIAACSTVEKSVKEALDNIYTGSEAAAALVGKLIAERGLKAGVDTVALDRSGFKYHGRILKLAEAARNAGLAF